MTLWKDKEYSDDSTTQLPATTENRTAASLGDPQFRATDGDPAVSLVGRSTKMAWDDVASCTSQSEATQVVRLLESSCRRMANQVRQGEGGSVGVLGISDHRTGLDAFAAEGHFADDVPRGDT